MKSMTIINPRGFAVVLQAEKLVDVAEWLGVTRQAINKAMRKSEGLARVQGYWVADMSMPRWTKGYVLTETEAKILGLPQADNVEEPEPKVCACCGREYIVGLWHSQKSQYCKVCIGTHRLILGRLLPTHTTNPVTDGVNVYASLKEAAESTGKPIATAKPAIYKVLVGEKRTYLGVSWRPIPKEPQ